MKRKASTRTGRRVRRKVTYRRKPRSSLGSLYTKRFVYKSDIVNSAPAVYPGGIVWFALGDVPAGNEITALFDQYKIMGVRYRWTCTRDPSTGASPQSYPRIMWVHDYTAESGAPSSFNEVQQYSNVREHYFTDNKQSTRWFWITPAVESQIQGGFFSGHSPRYRPWLACDAPNVAHHGIRYFAADLQSGFIIRLECYYFFGAKGVN